MIILLLILKSSTKIIKEQPNTYRLVWQENFPISSSAPKVITFTAKDPSVLLPNPDFLQVHGVIARILRVSGIGRKIDDMIEKSKMDDWRIRPDGGTDVVPIICRRLLMHV
jgi:hypothetical protein